MCVNQVAKSKENIKGYHKNKFRYTKYVGNKKIKCVIRPDLSGVPLRVIL